MRTVINIDDNALKYAMENLGTTTKVDTVNAALRQAAGDRLRRAPMDVLLANPDMLERLKNELDRDRREGDRTFPSGDGAR